MSSGHVLHTVRIKLWKLLNQISYLTANIDDWVLKFADDTINASVFFRFSLSYSSSLKMNFVYMWTVEWLIIISILLFGIMWEIINSL